MRDQTRRSCLRDLVELLRAHPEGLRRWSVMREMRSRRERAGDEVTLRFENEVERLFCRHCSGDPLRARLGDGTPELFHRPKGRTGEVWAAHPMAAVLRVSGIAVAVTGDEPIEFDNPGP